MRRALSSSRMHIASTAFHSQPLSTNDKDPSIKQSTLALETISFQPCPNASKSVDFIMTNAAELSRNHLEDQTSPLLQWAGWHLQTAEPTAGVCANLQTVFKDFVRRTLRMAYISVETMPRSQGATMVELCSSSDLKLFSLFYERS